MRAGFKRRRNPRVPPLAMFRVFPEPDSTLHARAYVWPTKAAMGAQLRREGVGHVRRTEAICRDIEIIRVSPGRPDRLLPVFAEVHFNVNRMGGEIVAHEFYHATAAWARRIRLDGSSMFSHTQGPDVSPEEERLCYAHGQMVRHFVNRAWKAGLY